MIDRILSLCDLFGPTGFEDEVREAIRAQAEPFADEILQDTAGNLLVFKRGRTRIRQTLLLSAHMDEPGIILRDADDKGFLKFSVVGEIDRRCLIGKPLSVGPERLPAVVGMKPIHLTTDDEQKSVPKTKDLYLDLGARKQDEAKRLVKPGDMACFASGAARFGSGYLKAKALDSRAGCGLLLALLERELPVDTWFAFTVQKQIGSRGAFGSAFRLKPDLALVLDAAPAADFPPLHGADRICELGKGPVIPFMDQKTIYDRTLIELLTAAADAGRVPRQTGAQIQGRSAAAAIQRTQSGCRAAALRLPVRYLHTPSALCAEDDVSAMKAILEAFLEKVEETYG